MDRRRQLRDRVEEAAAAFAGPLRLAAPRWTEPVFLEDPGAPIPGQREAWSARDIAEHVLSVDRMNAEAAARTVAEGVPIDLRAHVRQLPDWDWGNRSFAWLSLATAAEAVAAWDGQVGARLEFIERLAERDLDRPAGMNEQALAYMAGRGVPVANTVEGILLFCAEHARDHARQLRERFA